jgi:hypothetical protein
MNTESHPESKSIIKGEISKRGVIKAVKKAMDGDPDFEL